MIATRRAVMLGATALVPLAMAGCATGTLTPASIVTEAQAVAAGLAGMLKSVTAQYPTLIPASTAATIAADLTLAQSAATTLSSALPAATAASTVKTVEGYVNAVLTTLAGPPINGLIPAPFNMVVSAAAFVLPQLEAFAATYIPALAASPASASAQRLFLASAPPIADTALAVSILQRAAAGK
ncbi:MAG: hypothetical protein ACYC3L_00615 [Gemmatimonadaceae bacterium]